MVVLAMWIYTRAALKVMPPTVLLWPTTSEADVGGMTMEVEPSHQYFTTFCCHVIDEASDRLASDMEVHMKPKCEAEFLHVEKMAPTDIH